MIGNRRDRWGRHRVLAGSAGAIAVARRVLGADDRCTAAAPRDLESTAGDEWRSRDEVEAVDPACCQRRRGLTVSETAGWVGRWTSVPASAGLAGRDSDRPVRAIALLEDGESAPAADAGGRASYDNGADVRVGHPRERVPPRGHVSRPERLRIDKEIIMIMDWDHLVDYYGAEVVPHREHLERAHNTTYGLLCSRVSGGALPRLASRRGEHAEERLVGTSLWTQDIPAALEGWSELDDPIVTTLVVNRTPCHGCSHYLRRRINELHRRYPVRMDHSRFVLACLGTYEDADMTVRTTDQHLLGLAGAGWEICVLRVGDLTQRGEELCRGLVRLFRQRPHAIRLDG